MCVQRLGFAVWVRCLVPFEAGTTPWLATCVLECVVAAVIIALALWWGGAVVIAASQGGTPLFELLSVGRGHQPLPNHKL